MSEILIIDDDQSLCDMFSQQVRRMGHDASRAHTINEGLAMARARFYDVVFLDVHLPDGSGMDIIPQLQHGEFPPEIIIITGYGDADGAELAIRNGVWDYMPKTSSMSAVTLSLTRALRYREGKMAAQKPVSLKREGLVGDSPNFRFCLDLLAQAANSDANVLITGETGTGKELFARAIHNNSRRASKAFVVVDCTALPETLVESMLFGHEKGAFTGADSSREGLMKQADGGTLFLDEIGDLAQPIQKVFLRALQERRFRPIGGKKEVESDFRLITATNRNLDQMVERGELRRDLLFRLRSLAIDLPPLRERSGDVKRLVIHHVDRLCKHYSVPAKGFSPDFFEALESYDWPGNVRELIHTLDSAYAIAGNEPTLFSKHLSSRIRAHLARATFKENDSREMQIEQEINHDTPLPKLKDLKKTMEQRYLHNLMLALNGDIKKACQISGLSRSRLYGLLKEHDVPFPDRIASRTPEPSDSTDVSD